MSWFIHVHKLLSHVDDHAAIIKDDYVIKIIVNVFRGTREMMRQVGGTVRGVVSSLAKFEGSTPPSQSGRP